MTSARTPATSDLMALLCLMGGAVRGAGELQVLMQLLTIGALVPSFGMVLQTWIAAEERAGASRAGGDIWFPEEDAEDCETDAIGPGWSRRSGPILMWEHVTRFGTVMLIPLECVWMQRVEPFAVYSQLWSLQGLLLPVFSNSHFLRGLAGEKNCVLFVTISY